MIDINELRNDANTAHYGHLPLEVSKSEMLELLDRLEAAEKEREELHALIAAVKKQADAEFRLRMKKEEEYARLQVKIEAMEQQKPVATIHINSITGNPSVDFIPGHRYLHHNSSLYALPGAQAQPAPSVPREAIDKMLTQLMDTAVSNGANSVSMPDEYVEVAAWLCGIPAQPAPSVPEGWKLVPIEPTKEMIQKACSDHGYPCGDRSVYARGYRTMLAAAPEAKP